MGPETRRAASNTVHANPKGCLHTFGPARQCWHDDLSSVSPMAGLLPVASRLFRQCSNHLPIRLRSARSFVWATLMNDLCFKTRTKGNTTAYIFDRLLRDEQWAATGGSIETDLKSGGRTRFVLNFRSTAWADPFALLSLSCLLRNAVASSPGLAIEVDLGRPRKDSIDNRFLLFIASQGFLKTFSESAMIIWMGQRFRADVIPALDARMRVLNTVPAYLNSDCIGARLLEAKSLSRENIFTTVEGLVREAHETRINRWLVGNARQRGFLLHKLRVILAETLDNVSEHAYNHNGFGGVYARIRTGVPDDPVEFTEWSKAIRDERRFCPTMNRSNYGKRPGWLEVFVCDAGVGLTSHLINDAASPLLKLSNRLFREPVSKHLDRAAMGKTEVTGLQHIGFVLRGPSPEDRGDFVRLYSSGEWVGEHLPWPADHIRSAHRNYRGGLGAPPLSGTCYHFGLEPGPADIAEQQKLYPTFFRQPKREELASVREALSNTARPPSLIPHNFFDLYIGSRSAESTRGAAIRPWIRRITTDTVIIRPSRTSRKADLLDQVSQIATALVPVKRIIYCDVPSSLAIDMGHILMQEMLRLGTDPKAFQIYVVSQDWSCAAFVLTFTKHRFTSSAELAKAFVCAPLHEIGASFLASLLRARDSALFWENVGDAYLNEPVIWQPREGRIRGYLDLPHALSNRSRSETARRALRRAIMAFAHHKIVTSDQLAIALVDNDFEVIDGNRPVGTFNNPQRAVVVGSVLVTGSTSERFLRRSDLEVAGIVSLLEHVDARKGPGTRAPRVAALLWTPPRGSLKSPLNYYERIVGSPFVVRGGERAIPLPRFATPTKGKQGQSLYGDDPASAYARWQRLDLLRLGHWTYNLHHDLLTVKLSAALDFDMVDGGRILPWLTEIMKRWQAEYKRRRKNIVVAYPRHPVTDKLVRLFHEHNRGNGALNRETHPLDTIRFFPLQLARSASVSPIMVSPVERDRLGLYMAQHCKGGALVVLLDDGLVSGKTIDQLSQAVRGLWEILKARKLVEAPVLDIRTIALLDRTGLPTQRSIVEQSSTPNPRLWRWDVPPLGQEGSCRMCAILHRCRDLQGRVQSNEVANRVAQWLELWQPVPVEEHIQHRGLLPKRLETNGRTRFCIERLGSGREIWHEVPYITSTGLAALSTEICRSTTRREFPLRKSLDARLDSQTRIEILACQILLFLEELTYLDRVERLEAMLDLLWSCGETSPSTSLAGLSILVDPELADAIWSKCHALIEARGFPNDDCLIVAFEVHSRVRVALPRESNREWGLLQILVAPLDTPRGALAKIFQVFGWDGNSIHRGLLLDLLTKDRYSATDLYQIILMLEALASALEKLQPEVIATLGLNPHHDAESIRQMIAQIRLFAVRCIPVEVENADETTLLQLAAVACSADQDLRVNLQTLMRGIYDHLFVGPTSTQSRYKTALTIELSSQTVAGLLVERAERDLLDEWAHLIAGKGGPITQNWTSEPRIVYCAESWPTKPIRVYQDALIRRAFAEVLSNVMHRSQPIVCPWLHDGQGPQGSADMWVRVIPSEDESTVVVELANGAIDAESVRLRQTGNTAHLRALGGTVQTRYDPIKAILYTSLVVPTVIGLAWRTFR